MTLAHGQIVIGPDKRKWIALRVNRLRTTSLLPRPDMYLFRGYWYGGARSHLDYQCYGKALEIEGKYKTIARTTRRSAFLARKYLQ